MSIHDEDSFSVYRIAQPKKGKWRWLVWLIIIGLSTAAAWLAWQNFFAPSSEQTKPVQEPLRISAAIAEPFVFTPVIRVSGTLVAREDIAIGTALQDQRVSEVHVEVGDVVQRGQVLARLEPDQVQAQLQQAEATLARARASLRSARAQATEARATLARTRPLAKAGSVSQQQLDEQRSRAASAEATLRAARADVEQALAQVRDGRNQREKAEILAPADGVIAARTARAGTLAGSDALFRLIRDGQIELDADAASDDLVQLKAGMQASVQTGAHRKLTGIVRLVSPELDTRSRLGKVRIALPEAAKAGWHVGAYAEAWLDGPEQSLPIAVPERAVLTATDGQTAVMRIDDDGHVRRQTVKTGRRQGGILEIVSGLEAGQRVVRNAAAFVRDGDKVIVAETATEEGQP